MKWMRNGWMAVAALVVLIFAGAAVASEPTEREQYVGRAEPICKANVLANRRIFRGAKSEVKEGKLKLASKHFFRAAAAFGKTTNELSALPRPPADAATLTRWLGILAAEKKLIMKIADALAAEEKKRAESFSVELNRNSTKANNAVLLYGFDYCRIEPSRFG